MKGQPSFLGLLTLLAGPQWNHPMATGFSFKLNQPREPPMKLALIIVTAAALATPALADDVGVRVGPVGAGVSVGEGHRDYDRDRDHTSVIKEREPTDRITVIKKENEDGTRSKTVIYDHDHD
jgi:hypothetical protein